MSDRVGIGWRPELAAGILSNLSRIDVVEVIADDLFAAPARNVRAMQTLAAQVPVTLHGVGLGLASAEPVAAARLEAMARVVGAIEPETWSEHLAFVRGGGVEIGHLAAPPRNEATVAGTAANVARARAVVGTAPLLENIATLVEPPGSDLGEGAWVSECLRASGAGLLLDLNNLYSNAINFGHGPAELLARMPLGRVAAVHLAGGKWIGGGAGGKRLLDDHRHDVPEAVYGLLEELGARAAQPLTVILERDGAYPAMEVLLAQLDRARESLARGRGRARSEGEAAETPETATAAPSREVGQSQPEGAAGGTAPDNAATSEAARVEAFLARLYADGNARARFLDDPAGEGARGGLSRATCEDLSRLSRADLTLAGDSYAHRRAHAAGRRRAVPSRYAFFRS
jgi:uncharacterized protein (UPF0276 family)